MECHNIQLYALKIELNYILSIKLYVCTALSTALQYSMALYIKVFPLADLKHWFFYLLVLLGKFHF